MTNKKSTGNNKTHGHSKPSSTGTNPGVEQQAANAGRAENKGKDKRKNEEQNEADLEQQRKETLTERD